MRLDVTEVHALRLEETLQCADLVNQAVCQFLSLHRHLTSAKSLTVGQGWVRADGDAVGLCESHGRAHVVEVGGMKAASDIGDIDQRHQSGIISQSVKT